MLVFLGREPNSLKSGTCFNLRGIVDIAEVPAFRFMLVTLRCYAVAVFASVSGDMVLVD